MASSGASTGLRGATGRKLGPDDECQCGKKVRLRTSWTNDNPGRRFWTCGERVNGCGTFDWFDLEMCDRAKFLITDLKNKVNRLETELQVCNQKLSRLEEAPGVARGVKTVNTERGQSQVSFYMLYVVFFVVFAAVLLGNYFTR